VGEHFKKYRKGGLLDRYLRLSEKCPEEDEADSIATLAAGGGITGSWVTQRWLLRGNGSGGN